MLNSARSDGTFDIAPYRGGRAGFQRKDCRMPKGTGTAAMRTKKT